MTSEHKELKFYEATALRKFNLLESSSESVKLERVIDYKNAFLPQIILKKKQTRSNLEVNLDFKLRSFQIFFVVFWFMFLMLFVLVVSGWGKIFLCFLLILPFISFWWERKRSIQEIRKKIQEE